MNRPAAHKNIAPPTRSLHKIMGIGVAAILVWVGGCDLGSGPSPSPDALEAAAGTDQIVTVGRSVPIPPAVRVLNRKGKPMAGREVLFSVVSGGGQASGTLGTTDREGIARVGSWIMGTSAGTQILQVSVPELPPLVFSATAIPADPATILPQDGAGQLGTVGSALPLSPSVLVKDVFGNPVPGAMVEFLVTGGGGFLARNSAATDQSGIADPGAWTLGTIPGPNRLTASLPGLSPVEFLATANPDAPNRVTVLEGDGQVARVASQLPLPPTVLVADRFGNPLEGVEVSFEVPDGGGYVAESDPVTGPSGAATAESWTLGPMAGSQTQKVTGQGVAPRNMTANAKAGPPASALAQGGGIQTATVGTSVPDPPTVRVEDSYGNPVPDVRVTFSLVGFPDASVGVPDASVGVPDASVGVPDPEFASGNLTGKEGITDESGVAGAEEWTLGTLAGAYEVEAQVSGIPDPVAFFATATADVPSTLLIRGGDHQVAPFGTSVPEPLSIWVGDRYGNGVSQAPVSFTVVEGGGIIAGAQLLTDGEGKASSGSWTLGPIPGTNRVSATVGGAPSVTFVAVGLTAPPALMVGSAGNGQIASVGSPVSTPPQVRITDADGNPVSGVPVVFSVALGGGSVTMEESATDGDGLAEIGSWTLGTLAGQNRLLASSGTLPTVTFLARGIPGPPSSMTLNDGEGQVAPVGSRVPVPPSVLILDSFGNPVPDVAVTFDVTGGGGAVAGTPAMANGNGVARVGSWTLGPDPGPNRLTARLSGVSDVPFFATGKTAGGFQLDLEFMTAISSAQRTVFEDAALRWQEIIVGDIPDYGGTLPAGGCQPVLEAGGIDDVKIYVTVSDIDGSGGVLGRAGPCYYRTVGNIFPLTGIMELDEADLNDLQASGLLEDVILHEMGHVLGFGTLWNASTNDFLVGGGTADPYFNGPAAIAAFDDAGGAGRTDPKVPVENTGGSGTRDGHWRETVHNSELMTGWIEGGGVTNPLSAITIASLADMGYAVNMNAADPYLLFDPQGAPPRDPFRVRIYIQELPPPTPIPVGAGGGS